MGVSLVPNRILDETIRSAAGGADGADGLNFQYSEPHKAMVVGAFGAGKSTLVNRLVDPADESDPVAPEGDGARGMTQRIRLVFDGVLEVGRVRHRVNVYDTPGFNDPDKSPAQLMQELCRGTLHLAKGVDAIIHVLRKGRMSDQDRMLPRLLLDGLSHDAQSRQELIGRWQMVVTHADSGRTQVDEAQIEQFRGEMAAFFGDELRPVVQQAIFIENGPRNRPPYGDAWGNRDKILGAVVQKRRVYHSVYKSRPLEEAMAVSLRNIFTSWSGVRIGEIRRNEVTALLNHFETVHRQKGFVEMTPATTTNERFRAHWNSMSTATRDATAMQFADKVVPELTRTADSLWTRTVTREVFGGGGGGGGCFPGATLLQTPGGAKQLSELRVGEKVLAVDSSGRLHFDDVYFFGHADGGELLHCTRLQTNSDKLLLLSNRHFLPVAQSLATSWADRQLIYAQDVKVGDCVWVQEDNGEVSCEAVTHVSREKAWGAFNPYTLGGTLLANGVVASAHSDWLLDDICPKRFLGKLPAIYQAAFLPGRLFYLTLGSRVADALGMNNPQETVGEGTPLRALAFFVASTMLPATAVTCAALRSIEWF